MTTEKGLLELTSMVKAGEITCEKITQSYLDRIKEKDSDIKSYITVNEDAIKEAKKADQRRQKGEEISPFDGIPVAVKDNINTMGLRTTCASHILKDFVPPYDAGSVEKLKEAGMVILGKTNLDEFAMGSSTENSSFGPTKNPHDLTRVPGGSSGGSAASVAARLAPVSLGSDTGGSIRQPASFCGVVGIKPTYGRVSRYGLTAFASSLDQIGTFGNSVDDAAQLLALISGYDKRDSTSVDRPVDFAPSDLSDDVKGMVIGIPEEYYRGVNDEIKSAIDEKIELLKEQGAEVKLVSLKYTDYAIPVYYLIATAEASSNLARFDGVRYGTRSKLSENLSSLYLKSRSEGFGTEVKRRIILGTFSLSSGYYDAYYLKALKGRTLIINDFKTAFKDVDVLITPVTTDSAFKIGEMTNDPLKMYMSDILTISANLAGVPGLSMPIGKDSKNLPIGLQIMGSHFKESTILSIARVIEKSCETLHPNM
jgi:aspartyl-tRNA(Asn)/glutamyl-tRNA(Gln) amidotransferase subunit A